MKMIDVNTLKGFIISTPDNAWGNRHLLNHVTSFEILLLIIVIPILFYSRNGSQDPAKTENLPRLKL